ncbi:MAG: hypothetical protein GY847_32830, partial [Proteobacteria bacterium]|nr:hypothetical protein [Pseudomonadota bacterium]
RQKSGLPMGGRLSPIIANIYMEELEYQVLTSAMIVPKLYFRYVDDVFLVWDQSRGCYQDFLALLNSVHPDINLTVEEEANGQLSFLDVSISRPKSDNQTGNVQPLKVAIYRKDTHCDRYLKFKSSHPVPMMRSMVWGMALRAYRLLQHHPAELNQEIQHLKSTFMNKNNGYPEDLILRWFGQFRREIRLRPEILSVRSRLNFDDMFVFGNQQIFDFPSAESRFSGLDEGEGPNLELD